MYNVMIAMIVSIVSFLAAQHSVYAEPRVEKQILSNGLTVLVKPVKTHQKTSIQLWYNVGSKDEQTGEKGLAHFLEHTVFKGTDKLTSADIPAVTHAIAGYNNASTSFDWTNYYFNVPPLYWKIVLPILADCMQHCTFKQELLNAELKTVVQELRMYKDHYMRVMIEKMLTTVFDDHPYHYPIAGYKHDLYNMQHDNVQQFYHKHYHPSNAVLVIVGNVEAQEVFEYAQECFGSIAPDTTYQKNTYQYTKDLVAHVVKVYRDVKHPQVVVAFTIPGFKTSNPYVTDVLAHLLCVGDSSRLRKKLMHEKLLVNFIDSFSYNLFDHDLFCFAFEPNHKDDVATIITLIQKEIDDLGEHGISQQELQRAKNIVQQSFYELQEHNDAQARLIGQSYLATGDENYIFSCNTLDDTALQDQIQRLLENYFRPALMHTCFLLPLPDSEKQSWMALQEASNQEDAFIVANLEDSPLEEPSYVYTLTIEDPVVMTVPKPTQMTLSNGLKILYHHTDRIPQIELTIQLKASKLYDADTAPGLYAMLCSMLEQSTMQHSKQQLDEELENLAIATHLAPGTITMSMSSAVFEKALSLLTEMITQPAFLEDELEKVRQWSLAGYQSMLDDPRSIASELVYQHMYQGHPCGKTILGKHDTLRAISRDDLINFYKKYISPDKAVVAIVGNIEGYDLQPLLENTLGTWQGPEVEELTYPPLQPLEAETITYPMNRDQVVLSFATQSVARTHEDYNKLLIFDQMFGNGQHSRLFALREKTGAFYAISGTLLENVGKIPGIMRVTTIVSPDRAVEVEQLLQQCFAIVADTITERDITIAKRVLVAACNDRYATNKAIARSFVWLDHNQLPYDYFEHRKDALASITIEQVREAVKKIITQPMMTFKVGYVK